MADRTNRAAIVAHLLAKYDIATVQRRLPAVAVKLQREPDATIDDVDSWSAQAGGAHDPLPVMGRIDRPRRTPDQHKPVVYYLQFGPFIKIGTSRNFAARRQDIPHDRLVAWEPGSYDVEAVRHQQFAELRHRGEWFRAEGELLAHVAQLARRSA